MFYIIFKQIHLTVMVHWTSWLSYSWSVNTTLQEHIQYSWSVNTTLQEHKQYIW